MAPGRRTLNRPRHRGATAGYAALAAVTGVTIAAFAGLAGFAGEGPEWSLLTDPYLLAVLAFSLKQAGISAAVSVALAWPVARALYYHPALPARGAFLALCLLCFVMPSLVLVTGLVALLGHSGWLSPWLGEHWNLYGLNGIVIAHVYLNLPFATRVLHQQLEGTPPRAWRLARQLGLGPWQRLRVVEWPALRPALLPLTGFIAVLCFNSFSVVLALGGGPRATTLEVALYQALKYDFNVPEALTLAWIQLVIAGSAFLALTRLGELRLLSRAGGDTPRPQPKRAMRTLHALVYAGTWTVLLAPPLAIALRIRPDTLMRTDWSSLLIPTGYTLGLGLAAATVGMALAYLVVLPVRRAASPRARTLLDWLASHTLIAPAMVLSVGVYVLLIRRVSMDLWGLPLLAGLNALVVLPYAVQRLRPRLLQYDREYRHLVRSLDLDRITACRVQWPYIRPVVRATFALVLVLAMGDVAVFAIFGQPEWTTLPWLIYRYASTYRLDSAALASLLLLALCALAVALLERGSSRA